MQVYCFPADNKLTYIQVHTDFEILFLLLLIEK